MYPELRATDGPYQCVLKNEVFLIRNVLPFNLGRANCEEKDGPWMSAPKAKRIFVVPVGPNSDVPVIFLHDD